nr:reverse transcriptase domain-containing protein [Tanacetum cinerariifolium]
WFEKTKSVFRISECAEGKKVKFTAAILQGPALTWWKAKVATMSLKTVNQMPWTEMKQLIAVEFYPIEEVQRMEHELITKRKGTYEPWLPFLLMERSRLDNFLYVNVVLLAMLVRVRLSVQSVERLGTRQGHTRNRCPKKVKQEEVGEVHGRAYAIKDAEPQGLNVVTDWLVKHDVVIVCGEKVVRISYGNKMLRVESDKGVSRIKVISCIKARKYVERGCHMFLAHVTKKKSKEKRLEDMSVIRNFPEVFPKELPGLPPPRQVEF